ncbi:MAG: zinc ribbon domain-containing protein, partial [Firmicutes bacterium]|nr:zinc ribbon domain-containing protein [Bacillota bacterium]
CPFCGAELEPDAKFCGVCGARLTAPEPPAAPEPQPAPAAPAPPQPAPAPARPEPAAAAGPQPAPGKKFCVGCGKEIGINTRICNYCGRRQP